MRELKFRAWCHEDKVMIYDLNSPRLVHGELKDDLYEFMQYTGLTDKTGKEIYEGDILEYTQYSVSLPSGKENFTTLNIVEWCDTHTKFLLMPGCGFITSEGLIIGNIHEHPHLLETK